MPEYVSSKPTPKVQVGNFQVFGGNGPRGRLANDGDARTSLQRCLADWELPFVRQVCMGLLSGR